MQTNSRPFPAVRDESADKSHDDSIAKLEECLRAELSAVDTYGLALKSVTHVGLHRTLQEILTSHSRRAEKLQEEIGALGGEPPVDSGVSGAFAKLLQVGADLLGNRTAIGALEAGEDRGLELYTGALRTCDAQARKLIELDLLPEQQRTHELCRTLKDFVEAPS